MKHFDLTSFNKIAESMRRPFHEDYFAMYSSVYDGIVKDPVLMMVPLDDHMVHRGDGIFETCKCIEGSIYNMKAHLDRLSHAATELMHKPPCSMDDIQRITIETVKAGGQRNCTIRIFISRGSGSFGVNPNDCPASHLYVVVTRLKSYANTGKIKLKTSTIPVKTETFAALKHCNYLNNALMAKEAKDAGADFAAAFDAEGHLAEGATENIGIVTGKKELLFPRLNGILCGTTMMRVMELANQLVEKGELTRVGFEDIDRDTMLKAEEILIVGTTPDVIGVSEFDDQFVDSGEGRICARLTGLIQDDMRGNADMLTPVVFD